MDLEFICTGGTIDKDYSGSKGTYDFHIGEPAVIDILKKFASNINFVYNIKSILKKDSLDVTDDDRELIYHACKVSSYGRIIISHGTDTLIDTARKLSSLTDKVIIIFGSSRPAKFKDSEAEFNLGYAICAATVKSNGVYIAMNGMLYNWDECEKRSDGIFIKKC